MKYKGFTISKNQGYYRAFRKIKGKSLRVHIGKNIDDHKAKIDAYIAKYDIQVEQKDEYSTDIQPSKVEQLQKQVEELQRIVEKQQLQIELLQKQKPAPASTPSAEIITGQDVIHSEKILGFEIYRKEGKSFWYARRDIKGRPYNVKIGNDVANANRMILRYLSKNPDIEEYLMREK